MLKNEAERVADRCELMRKTTHISKHRVFPEVCLTKEEALTKGRHVFSQWLTDGLRDLYGIKSAARMVFTSFSNLRAFVSYRNSFDIEDRTFIELFTTDLIKPVFDIELKNVDQKSPDACLFDVDAYIKEIEDTFKECLKTYAKKKEYKKINSVKFIRASKCRKQVNGLYKLSFHLIAPLFTLPRVIMHKVAMDVRKVLDNHPYSLFNGCVDTGIYNGGLIAVGCHTPGKNNYKISEPSRSEMEYFHTPEESPDDYSDDSDDDKPEVQEIQILQKAIKEVKKQPAKIEFAELDAESLIYYVSELLKLITDRDYQTCLKVGFSLGSLPNKFNVSEKRCYDIYLSFLGSEFDARYEYAFFNSDGRCSVGSLRYMAKKANAVKYKEIKAPAVLNQKATYMEYLRDLTGLRSQRAKDFINEPNEAWNIDEIKEAGYKYTQIKTQFIESYPQSLTTFIKAPKGSGKSYSLSKHLQEVRCKSALALCYRRSLGLQNQRDFSRTSGDLKAQSAGLSNLDFSYYLESMERLDIKETPFLSVQLESISKVKNWESAEYLIIDEFRSLLCQLMSPTVKNHSRLFSRFTYMLKTVPFLILLDADISKLELDFIAKFRPVKSTRIIESTYNNNEGKNVVIYMHRDTMIKKMVEDVKNSKRIIINSNRALPKIQQLAEVLKKYKSDFDEKCLIITSETKNQERQAAALKNPESRTRGFEIYDIVIYSPTIESGISYNPKIPRFDSFYGDYYNNGGVIKTDQGAERVRQFRSKTYNFHFMRNRTHNIPTQRNVFNRYMIFNKLDRKFINALPNVEYDENDHAFLFLHDYNRVFYELYRAIKIREAKDIKNYLPRFIRYKYRIGFRNFTIVEEQAKIEDAEGFAQVLTGVLRRRLAQVVNADAITSDEADAIDVKITEEKELSEGERAARELYLLESQIYNLDFDLKDRKDRTELIAMMRERNFKTRYIRAKYILLSGNTYVEGVNNASRIERLNVNRTFVVRTTDGPAQMSLFQEIGANLETPYGGSSNLLQEIIRPNEMNRIKALSDMLTVMGYSGPLDRKTFTKEELGEKLEGAYDVGIIENYINYMADITNDKKLTGILDKIREAKDRREYLINRFVYSFNSQAKKYMGIKIESERIRVRGGQKIRRYSIRHNKLWWFLSHHKKIKNLSIMDGYDYADYA